jgi:hypothetical protein
LITSTREMFVVSTIRSRRNPLRYGTCVPKPLSERPVVSPLFVSPAAHEALLSTFCRDEVCILS